MSKYAARRFLESRFTVEGVGAFPLDLLRFDQCFPETEKDSGALERGGRRTVTLRRRTLQVGDPSEGRWAAVGWTVTNVEAVPVPA